MAIANVLPINRIYFLDEVFLVTLPARATAARFCAASFFSFLALAACTRPFCIAAAALALTAMLCGVI